MVNPLGKTLKLTAPAKLNLFLHIVGVRPDGYHNLQTVFQLLDYGDEISLTPTDDGVISRSHGLGSVAEDDDLVIRAARLLQQHTGTHYGAIIGVDKRLPVGGGIGGGSSDAATTLLGLNALWGCDLSSESLQKIGAELGADIPVFVAGHSAWAEGIGEQLTPLDLPEVCYLVLHPGVAISTPELFSAAELTRNCPLLRIRDFPASGGMNVFEPLVRVQYPEVDQAISWLSEFSEARLTGTGSCIFAKFSTKQDAQKVLEIIPKPWTGFIGRALNESPVLNELATHSR